MTETQVSNPLSIERHRSQPETQDGRAACQYLFNPRKGGKAVLRVDLLAGTTPNLERIFSHFESRVTLLARNFAFSSGVEATASGRNSPHDVFFTALWTVRAGYRDVVKAGLARLVGRLGHFPDAGATMPEAGSRFTTGGFFLVMGYFIRPPGHGIR